MKAERENARRLQTMRMLGAHFVTRIGQITSYDPNRQAVKVTYQPDDIKSGWLPLAAAWVGNGWGMFAAPVIGQTIEVSFLEGALDSGIANLRLYNNANQPLAVPAGEFWLVHANGQFLKLTNDGRLTISDNQGATIYLDGTGKIVSEASQWTHTGAIDFNGVTIDTDGNVTSPETITGQTQVVAGSGGSAVHLTTHTHPTAGSGPPSAPTPGT